MNVFTYFTQTQSSLPLIGSTLNKNPYLTIIITVLLTFLVIWATVLFFNNPKVEKRASVKKEESYSNEEEEEPWDWNSKTYTDTFDFIQPHPKYGCDKFSRRNTLITEGKLSITEVTCTEYDENELIDNNPEKNLKINKDSTINVETNSYGTKQLKITIKFNKTSFVPSKGRLRIYFKVENEHGFSDEIVDDLTNNNECNLDLEGGKLKIMEYFVYRNVDLNRPSSE